VRRTPKWIWLALAVIAAAAVAVALVQRPSQAQRAADMASFLRSVNYDIESCAGGVSESLGVLHDIQTGSSHDVGTAMNVAATGAANCSPANSMQLDDLESYQVSESLASFRLARVVTGLVAWAAPDAINVQNGVARALRDRGTSAEAGDLAALQQAVRELNAQRAIIESELAGPVKSLHPHAREPRLPG
jgi:hypothetical protein